MDTGLEIFLRTSKKSALKKYVEAHPDCFTEAIHLVLTDKKPFSWRAAWLIGTCMQQNDQRISIHAKELVQILPQKSEGEQREVLKILYRVNPGEAIEGMLFDACVTLWENLNKLPSVRFNALKQICKITLQYPDMQGELAALTQSHYLAKLSLPFKKSVAQLLKTTMKEMEKKAKSAAKNK